MTVIAFILGFAIAVAVTPAGVSTQIQKFLRRKVSQMINNRKGGQS